MRIASLALGVLVVSCSSPPPPAPRPAPPPAPVAAPRPAPVPEPAPLTLAPADGPDLVGVVVVASLERTLKATLDLARAVRSLPLDAAGVRSLVMSRAGVPDEVASALDLTRPIALALSYDGETGHVLAASAVAHKGKAALAAGLEKLGPPSGQRGEARAYSVPGGQGTLWTLVESDVAFFANDALALERAARSAEKAQKAAPGSDDVVATTWPARWKSAAGFDLEANARLVSGQVATAGALVPNGELLVALAAPMLGAYAARIGEAEAVAAYARIDAAVGVELGMRFDARAGTILERVAKAPPPPLSAPVLVQEGRPAVLFATSARVAGEPTPVWDAVLAAIAGSPSERVRDVGAFYRAFFVECDGSMAGSMTSEGKGGLRMNGVFGARDEAAAARYLALLTKDGGRAMSAVMAMGTGPQQSPLTLKLRAEKVGGKPGVVTTVDAPRDHPMRELLVGLYGKLPVQSFMVASGPRVGMTFGGDARPRMARLLKSPVATPADPLLAAAFSRGAERSAVMLVDVAAYARWMTASMAGLGQGIPPGLQALGGAKEPLPVIVDWGTVAGSGRVDGRLRVPVSLFRGLGRLFGST